MSLGTITLGRFTLSEAHDVSRQQHETFGTKSIALAGTETYPGRSDAVISALAEDLMWIKDQVVAVQFSRKSDMNGFYRVMDSGSNYLLWMNVATAEARAFTWALQLQYLGSDAAVEMESRVSATVRANNYALTGERWHAPPIGHYGYFTGATPPSGTVVRTGFDGAITVYRSVPASVNPRWGCDVADLMKGRVKVESVGIERSALSIDMPLSSWALDNGLVRVTPMAASGLLNVATYRSGFQFKAWNIGRAGVNLALTDFKSATITRNDPEMCTIRLMTDRAPGRNLLDLTLRRGSRFVECYLQTDSAANLTATLQSAEGQTDNTASGYVVATGNDGNGDRYFASSSKTVTAVAGGGLQRAASTTFDFSLGVVFNGGTAAAGDAATVLRDQYIAAMAEQVTGVKR